MIVDLIAEGEIGVRQIAAMTGMCSFDSTEVADMLAYLTTFGRVEHTDDGWVIHPEADESEYARFRTRNIETAKAILEKLSIEAKTVSELSKETNLSNETIELFLPFLAEISRLGVISRCYTDWPITWCQASS
jgi:DNA-binding IclR family transcriptional regulator